MLLLCTLLWQLLLKPKHSEYNALFRLLTEPVSVIIYPLLMLLLLRCFYILQCNGPAEPNGCHLL
jgi:hypothetical protein